MHFRIVDQNVLKIKNENIDRNFEIAILLVNFHVTNNSEIIIF